MKTHIHLALLAMVALSLITGCEREVAQTEQAITGSWQAQFADALVTISLGNNGTFLIEPESEGKGGSMLFLVSAWGKLPPVGRWRLGDGEITFSDKNNVTLDGLEILKLYENRVRLRVRSGSEVEFERVTARPTPPVDQLPTPYRPGDDFGE